MELKWFKSEYNATKCCRLQKELPTTLLAQKCIKRPSAFQTEAISEIPTVHTSIQRVRKSLIMTAPIITPKRPLTWLVTGCSSGFGLSLARIIQANGHNLVATSREPSKTPDLVSEIEGKGGKWLKLDVNDLNCDRVIEELEAQGQSIDVLVSNAGFCIYNVAENLTEKEVRDLMETLYFGPSRLIRAAVKHQRQRKFGVIVNISSGAALEANPSMGAYAAGKGALDCM